MNPVHLEEMDVSGLEILSCPYDLRQDLHRYMEFVDSREIKRTTRDNRLPKAEAKRLAKLLKNPEVGRDVERMGFSPWLAYVEKIALSLGFVSYDTEGEYLGYSSVTESYPDNFIEVNLDTYQRFLNLPLQEREQRLLSCALNDYAECDNEFFQTSVFGRLDTFSRAGCATGVLPYLNFAAIRRFLLDLLAQCRSQVWYSVESLLMALKTEHPFFLIPKNAKHKGFPGQYTGRYSNFRESGSDLSKTGDIASYDPDAFERVEGRYVERFLENIPLTFGYLALAYQEPRDDGISPSLNELQGFKLNDVFLKFMNKQLPEPRVTLEPTFEIQVESEVYPARILSELSLLTDVIRLDTVSTLKLQRKKVTQALAQGHCPDVIALLKRLTQAELPGNVRTELEEWAGQAEAFTVYSGFGVLESERLHSEAEPFVIISMAKGLSLIQDPEGLFAELETSKAVPLLIKHPERSLKALPEGARTSFPQAGKKKKTRKKSVQLKRSTWITLYCPDKEFFETFSQALIQAKCAFEPDRRSLALSYPKREQKEVETALKGLQAGYHIRIKEIEQ